MPVGLLLLIPFLAFAQEPPPPEKQTPKDQSAKPRLDVYGDPLPEGAIARMGTVRFRHLGLVNCVAYSPSGKLLATGGDDWTVRLWEVETGRPIRVLRTGGRVTSVAFSPDGRCVAAGDSYTRLAQVDYPVHVWNVETGEEVQTLRGVPKGIQVVAFSPDGNLIAAGIGRLTQKGGVAVWDLGSGKKLFWRDEGPGAIFAVAFAPDGQSLLAGAPYSTESRRNRPKGQSKVNFHDPRTGERQRGADSGVRSPILSLAHSRSSDLFATGHLNGSVYLWDTGTRKLLRQLREHTSSVWSVALAPDGHTIAAGAKDGSVRIWGVRSGTLLREIRTPTTLESIRRKIRGLAYSPDSKRLAVAGGEYGPPHLRHRHWEPGHEDGRAFGIRLAGSLLPRREAPRHG